ATEASEEAEQGARVRLDADLARGVPTEGRAAQARSLAYLLEGLGIPDPAEVAAAAAFRKSSNVPAGLFDRAFPEAQATIRRVKAAGLVVGVVSNSNGNARALLTQAGLDADLDFVIDSGVVGVEKPDPRIFALAL